MMPGLQQGYRAIQGAPASIKHVIALTDGQTAPGAFNQLAVKMRDAGITTSGVAVGPDADRSLLAGIAKSGGGKFYYLQNPKAIPRIFMREARRVAMPLVFEDKQGFAVNVVSPDNELSGIDRLPPITGYVLTTIKQNPLVEVLAATPRQPPPNSTIMASWTYGLGRAAVLTTDVGQRWATTWPAWDNYEKLLLQLVRRSMRSHDANEQLAMSTELSDGKIRLVVNALDRDDQHVNYLSLSAAVVRPDGTVDQHELEQTAPGPLRRLDRRGGTGQLFPLGERRRGHGSAPHGSRSAANGRVRPPGEQRDAAGRTGGAEAGRRRAGGGDCVGQRTDGRGRNVKCQRLPARRSAGREPQPDLAAGAAGSGGDFSGRRVLPAGDGQLRVAAGARGMGAVARPASGRRGNGGADGAAQAFEASGRVGP